MQNGRRQAPYKGVVRNGFWQTRSALSWQRTTPFRRAGVTLIEASQTDRTLAFDVGRWSAQPGSSVPGRTATPPGNTNFDMDHPSPRPRNSDAVAGDSGANIFNFFILEKAVSAHQCS
jgi:hypothetical protein